MSKQQQQMNRLIEQRERLEIEAWDFQRVANVRTDGPVLAAYGVIINALDARIAELRGTRVLACTCGEKE